MGGVLAGSATKHPRELLGSRRGSAFHKGSARELRGGVVSKNKIGSRGKLDSRGADRTRRHDVSTGGEKFRRAAVVNRLLGGPRNSDEVPATAAETARTVGGQWMMSKSCDGQRTSATLAAAVGGQPRTVKREQSVSVNVVCGVRKYNIKIITGELSQYLY